MTLAAVIFLVTSGWFSWPVMLSLLEVIWTLSSGLVALFSVAFGSPSYLGIANLMLALGAAELAILMIIYYSC